MSEEDLLVKAPPAEGLNYNINNVKASLDEKYYRLEGAEFEFWSTETGIKDPELLKQHIVAVQHEVYQVSVYRKSSSLCYI